MRYFDRFGGEVFGNVRVFSKRPHVERKLADERHSAIAIVLPFGRPLNCPLHHQLPRNRIGRVVLLDAEPIKRFENIGFKIVLVPAGSLLRDEADDIGGQESSCILSFEGLLAFNAGESNCALTHP